MLCHSEKCSSVERKPRAKCVNSNGKDLEHKMKTDRNRFLKCNWNNKYKCEYAALGSCKKNQIRKTVHMMLESSRHCRPATMRERHLNEIDNNNNATHLMH